MDMNKIRKKKQKNGLHSNCKNIIFALVEIYIKTNFLVER